jgi:hypothetical protein
MNYDDLNRPIEELCLSIRSINRLRKGKVFTIRDLVVLTAKQLVERTKISEASFQELTDELDSLGLSLGMTINGERAILASSPNSTEYPPPPPPDPARYVQFYRAHGYSFLPQSLMESFYQVIAQELNQRIDYSQKRTPKPSLPEGRFDNYEDWKSFRYYEGQIRQEQDLLFLADELMFLGLYRFIEIERLRVLKRAFPHFGSSRTCSYSRLVEQFPWLQQLFGSSQVNEIRLINNCIKHSGKVSRELAKFNAIWKESEYLSGLRHAYERLAPYVGAYWVDLVDKCKDKEPSGDTASKPTRIS